MRPAKRSTLLAIAGATLAPAAHAQFGGGRNRAPANSQESAPLAKSDAERTALAVLEDIDRRQRYLNVSRDDGRLLRILVETSGAKHVVEIGTSTGYSGLWMALGLRATGGRLTTLEIDAGRAATAAENFKRAGLDDRVTIVRGDAHAEVERLRGPIDLVFIDADKEGYPHYFAKVAPLVRPGGLVVADNMVRPPADPAYVRAITTDADFETVFVNTASGFGVTLKKG